MQGSPSGMDGLMRFFTRLFRTRTPNPVPRLAVLIDGDGISPKSAGKVLERLPTFGRVCILRAYGNYSGAAAAAWTGLIRKHGIVARHMSSVTPGKNATDIALAIDAVELCFTRSVDAFVLIASDSDFTPLAGRLREEGKDVIGFGNNSTPAAFRSACTSFYEIHTVADLKLTSSNPSPAVAHWGLQPADAEEAVATVLRELSTDGEPIALTVLGQHLARHLPNFDPRTYSRRTLTDLLRDLPTIVLVEQNGKRHASLRKPTRQERLTSEGPTEG